LCSFSFFFFSFLLFKDCGLPSHLIRRSNDPTVEAFDLLLYFFYPVLLILKVACSRRSRAFSGIGVFINPGVATDTDHGVLLLWKYLALDAAAFWPGERSKRIVNI
jgi:hypothetical protein